MQELETLMPHDLVNPKPVSSAIKEFFGTYGTSWRTTRKSLQKKKSQIFFKASGTSIFRFFRKEGVLS